MFNLINTFGNDVDYLAELPKELGRITKEAQDLVSSSKTVTVQLVHEYQLNKKPRSVANIRYNTEEKLGNNKVSCGSHIEPLADGTNYTLESLNNVIEGVIQEVNQQIDTACMFGEILEADDIQDRVTRCFKGAMESVYIWDGYNVSAVVVANELTEIVVVVC